MKIKLKKALFTFFLFSIAVLPATPIDLWDAIKFNGPLTLVDKWKAIIYSGFYASDINLDEVRQALEEGANVNRKNKSGWSALLHAACLGHSDLVKLLLENKADVNQQDRNGRTALMHAVVSPGSSTVKVLIENQADLGKQDEDGKTALMHSVLLGRPNAVRVLLENQADLNQRDRRGRTALSLALMMSDNSKLHPKKRNPEVKKRRSEVVKLLRHAEEDERVSKEKR